MSPTSHGQSRCLHNRCSNSTSWFLKYFHLPLTFLQVWPLVMNMQQIALCLFTPLVVSVYVSNSDTNLGTCSIDVSSCCEKSGFFLAEAITSLQIVHQLQHIARYCTYLSADTCFNLLMRCTKWENRNVQMDLEWTVDTLRGTGTQYGSQVYR